MKKTVNFVLLLSILLFGASCTVSEISAVKEKSYLVKRIDEPLQIDANWDKSVWQDIKPLTLGFYMGEKPEYFPTVKAKLAYDNDNIYVIFKVDDKYVKAVAESYNEPVCLDSCVEFFFTPGERIADGYFNLETNCAGTILMYHQLERGVKAKPMSEAKLDQIEIAHSMPGLVKEEIKTPITWTLEYRLPLSILESHSALTKPKSGAKWKANFYKCADNTSNPHWLTWSYVDKPQPDFHRPEYFGTLIFE
ncbi:carbohydrate-binding family 9-like protein [Sedimentisphaera salicampi]|uniref:carbohydrate-binding family 9-like protein n=1 Tax=Sedimentisphaera salicampi TaxID=1941349 RepID=UPI000B9C442B|nr:carbohydrate-binding family 9-like protein [Sedimentisphaera salicampi]OXU15134.1 hypothetical protein SMSP1_01064 [Sedimentisphaera salicampi]